jgi:hypothetical protein
MQSKLIHHKDNNSDQLKKNLKDLITKWLQTQISLGCEQN